MGRGKTQLFRVVQANDADCSAGKHCRECDAELEHGELCFGKLQYQYLEDVARGREGRGTWRCFGCVDSHTLYIVITNDGDVFDLEAMSGFESLPEEQKEEVRTRFKEVEAKMSEIKAERREEREMLRQEQELLKKQAEQAKAMRQKEKREALKAAKAAKERQPRSKGDELRAMFAGMDGTARADKAVSTQPIEVISQVVPPAAQLSTANKKRKEEKDPNAPKKPLSAYILFTTDTDTVEKVKAAHPDAKPKEMMALKSKAWNALSDDEKKPWEEKAAAEKKRYIAAEAAYKDSDQHKAWLASHPPSKSLQPPTKMRKVTAQVNVQCVILSCLDAQCFTPVASLVVPVSNLL